MLVATVALFSRCSKTESAFDYEKEALVGKWKLTEILIDGHYITVTEYPYNKVIAPTYVTFYSNDTFYGEGYFGQGNGTYKATGKTVTCYLEKEKEPYAKYRILSLKDNACEAEMTMEGESITIRCVKQ